MEQGMGGQWGSGRELFTSPAEHFMTGPNWLAREDEEDEEEAFGFYLE